MITEDIYFGTKFCKEDLYLAVNRKGYFAGFSEDLFSRVWGLPFYAKVIKIGEL